MAVLCRIRRFIPKIGDNHKLPEDEQIIARMKSVDVRARQVHIRQFLKMKPEEITARMMDDKGSKEIQDILFANVVGFENLTFEDVDDNGETIKRNATIQDVWDQGEFQLCMELFNAILSSSQLGKEEEKNSESQSGSTPQQEAEAAIH